VSNCTGVAHDRGQWRTVLVWRLCLLYLQTALANFVLLPSVSKVGFSDEPGPTR